MRYAIGKYCSPGLTVSQQPKGALHQVKKYLVLKLPEGNFRSEEYKRGVNESLRRKLNRPRKKGAAASSKKRVIV